MIVDIIIFFRNSESLSLTSDLVTEEASGVASDLVTDETSGVASDLVTGEVSGVASDLVTGEVSGVASDLVTGEVSGVVEGNPSVVKRVDGSICLSVTSPGLRGYIQHFLKPDMMFTGIIDWGHATPTRLAICSVVITRFECSANRFLHAL